jgi:hypothetical protein
MQQSRATRQTLDQRQIGLAAETPRLAVAPLTGPANN